MYLTQPRIPDFIQPLDCGCSVDRCACVGTGSIAENGCTLVIHKIVLDACGGQSCTPRTFSICVKGPSYPNGEVFQLTAGSCLEIDEPLILAGLICGDYTIEEICDTGRSYCSTITGPNVCGNCVRLVPGCPPAVVTIVNRRRICRWVYWFSPLGLYRMEPPSPRIRTPSTTYKSSSMQMQPSGGRRA